MSSERLSSFGGGIRFCPLLAWGLGQWRGSAPLSCACAFGAISPVDGPGTGRVLYQRIHPQKYSLENHTPKDWLARGRWLVRRGWRAGEARLNLMGLEAIGHASFALVTRIRGHHAEATPVLCTNPM